MINLSVNRINFLKDLQAVEGQNDVIDKILKLKEKYKGRYKGELFDLIESLLQYEPSKKRNLESVQEYLERNYPEIINYEQIVVENGKLQESIKDFEEKLKIMLELKPNPISEIVKVKEGEPNNKDSMKIQERLDPSLFPDERKFEGESQNDKGERQGIFVWPNGDRYEGEFHDGLRHGKGILMFSDGRKYEGEWKNDKKEGYGVLTWSNRDRYEGQFQDDLRHGNGTLQFSGGRRYEGEYKKDKREGHGIETWPNGDCYTGLFQDDLRHGKGIFISIDGHNKTGLFILSKFVGEEMQQTDTNRQSLKQSRSLVFIFLRNLFKRGQNLQK